MKFFKKALIASAVTAASFGALSTASAATLDVDVDITLPEVIILYAFTDIDLTLAADQIGPLLDNTCTTDQCAVDMGVTTGVITAGAVDLGLTVTPTAGADLTVTLNNSWGVRGLGFANYAETITAGADNEVTSLVIEDLGAPTLELQTGFVSFDIDSANPDPDADGFVEANYTITVVGS